MYLNLDSELVCEPLLPASDLCLFDYDSGLPLSSVEFLSSCSQFDIIFNKYLQMDPTVSASPSQKTSPHQDPADFSRLASEVSNQANVLTAHQQQLVKLTTLTEKLARTVQSLSLPNATENQTSNPAAPASAPPVVSNNSIQPKLSLPEKFDGSPSACKGFLLQCSLYFDQQTQSYSTDESRVSFICSLLTGRALEWATALWYGGQLSFPSYNEFLTQFREVFEHSAGGKDPGELLLTLRQGNSTAADYTLSFRTLAAQTGWKEEPLRLIYRKGLNPNLQGELACRDDGKTLKQIMELAIRLDNLLRSRRTPLRSSPLECTLPSAELESMQIGYTRLSTAERERRCRNHLCMYCGEAGHLKATCPVNPALKNSAAVSSNRSSRLFSVESSLKFNGQDLDIKAFIDSGAAGNFIDLAFAKTHRVSLCACKSGVTVEALDGRPLGSGEVQYITQPLTLSFGKQHSETIQFFTIHSPGHPVILGLPWLE